MGFKGFSASYVAVDPFEDFEENVSESYEATPFPGSLKSIYHHNNIDDNDEDEDNDDFSYNSNRINQKKNNNKKHNLNEIITSDEAID